MALTLQTPNVYINEVNAFPNSVVAVATAIPLFIGYTRRADHEGKSYYHQTVEIHSLNDFLTFFGAMSTGPVPGPAPDLEQYAPIYHVVSSKGNGDMLVGGRPMDLLPDAGTIYYLYNSIKLFYENGGGTAFVVSVGPMVAGTGKPMPAGDPLINPNVQYTDLNRGLGIGGQEPRITMIVIPDAVLLKEADYYTLLENVLQQCGDSQNRVGIIDVYGGDNPDPEQYLTTKVAKLPYEWGDKSSELRDRLFPVPALDRRAGHGHQLPESRRRQGVGQRAARCKCGPAAHDPRANSESACGQSAHCRAA